VLGGEFQGAPIRRGRLDGAALVVVNLPHHIVARCRASVQRNRTLDCSERCRISAGSQEGSRQEPLDGFERGIKRDSITTGLDGLVVFPLLIAHIGQVDMELCVSRSERNGTFDCIRGTYVLALASERNACEMPGVGIARMKRQDLLRKKMCPLQLPGIGTG